ncbi:MAG TPA: M23 family metallopeptidase, partial [Clostridia bacterium]|nr:M23 family metallopeptidase [Clostridia bacterium]
MSKFKESTSKIGAFFKKNIYLILIIFSVAVIATLVGLALGGVFDQKEPPINFEDPNDNDPADTDPNDNDPTDNPDDDEPVVTPVVFTMPVEGATEGNGYNETPVVYYSAAKEYKTHLGLDFIAPEGSEVSAAYKGTVTAVTTEVYHGTTITITHADGLTTVYSSLSPDVKVAVGDIVAAGQLIGYVSDSMDIESGLGTHLHFEVLEDGVHVDP